MSAKTGYVVATHPGDHSVDVLLSDGRRLTGVQVLSADGSSRSGTSGLPSVPAKTDKWDITKLTGQDMKAVVTFIDGVPVVSGFLFPQISQMTFDDPKLRVTRHESDVYTSIDGDGNWQQVHPAGAFMRMGTTPELDDLAGKNTDKTAAFDRNTAQRVHFRIQMGGNTASFTMSPDGKVDLVADQDVNVSTKGAANVMADGDILLKSGGTVTIDAANSVTTGNLSVLGHLSFAAGLSGVGANGGPTVAIIGDVAVQSGTVAVTGGDVTADGISLHSHHHDNTGPPVGGG